MGRAWRTGRTEGCTPRRIAHRSVRAHVCSRNGEPKLFFVMFACDVITFHFENFVNFQIATFLKGEWARSHILSFISCIGGGVFLGACLLDLLPGEKWKILQKKKNIREMLF